jgi:hypothetical protein
MSPHRYYGIPQIPLKTDLYIGGFPAFTGARRQGLPRIAIVVVEGLKHLLLVYGVGSLPLGEMWKADHNPSNTRFGYICALP